MLVWCCTIAKCAHIAHIAIILKLQLWFDLRFYINFHCVMGVNIDLVTRRAKLNLRQKIRHCSLCNFQITLFQMNLFKWIFHPNCRVHLATATTRAATTTQKPLGLMSDQMLAYIVQPTWWWGGPAPPGWEALPPHPAVHIPAYMFPRWWHHISFLCCWHIIPSSTEPSVVLRSDHCCCIFFFLIFIFFFLGFWKPFKSLSSRWGGDQAAWDSTGLGLHGCLQCPRYRCLNTASANRAFFFIIISTVEAFPHN